jgi:hypothetical protein
MNNDKISTCCTCGYSWPTGTDGSHSCIRALKKQRDLQLKTISQFAKLMDDILPQIGSIVLQDYALLNEALMGARDALKGTPYELKG